MNSLNNGFSVAKVARLNELYEQMSDIMVLDREIKGMVEFERVFHHVRYELYMLLNDDFQDDG